MELIPDIRICGDDYSVKIKLCGLGEPLRFDTGTNPKWLLIKKIIHPSLKTTRRSLYSEQSTKSFGHQDPYLVFLS